MASTIITHWHQPFDNTQLSTLEFYQLLYEELLDRKLPDVSILRVEYAESGMFSAKREYFRVQRNEYSFDICAAPFGKDFFISYWLSEVPGCLVDLISLIPFLGPIWARALMRKTFYQQDTEIMFKSSVQSILKAAIDKVSADGKGLRKLSDKEFVPQFDNIRILDK